MRALILAPALAVVVSAIGLLFVACDGEKIDVSCGEIPDGGCKSAGDADLCTTDRTCRSVYTCTDARWRLVQACTTPPLVDASAPEHDAAPPRDASLVDVEGAFGGPGCADLQVPECSLGLASSCTDRSCCGCDDVFVCQGGGWVLYGSCQNGQIVSSP